MRVNRVFRGKSACSVWCLAAAGLLVTGSVAAQESADIAAARSFAVEGLKLADGGRCDQAIDKLQRAEKLHHSAIVLGKLGECLVNQGRIVEGSEALRKMLREPPPANPSPALLKAYERAQTALDTAKPQIANVVITVRAPNGVEPAVTIDGQPVPAAVLGGDRPTDPGEHVIEASAPGYLKASSKFNIGPGRKQSIELVLERDPSAPVAPPPGTSEANGTGTPGEAASNPEATPYASNARPEGVTLGTEGAPNRTAAYVSWVLGGVALGVGAGFGYIALKDKNDLDDKCSSNVCPRSEQDSLDSAKRAGTISTIAIGVGAAGVVLGTVLFFTASPSSTPAADSATAAKRRRFAQADTLRARAGLGVGQVKLAVDF
ncbi:MAG TPA: hypothetical protein VK524_17040 [Polyangiaceae bacterium]|nr:hypothetical protein [Polyangiaceae bacterium]